MMNNKKCIVPVLAVVVLIAVAVALGIAVAFWATGLIGTLGKVEKLEIRTAYAVNNQNGTWMVTLSDADTGSADITIVEVTINGESYNEINAIVRINGSSIPASIKAGESFTANITIPSSGFRSGQTIEVALISGSGTLFKRTVVLP